jgi:NTP pyrophosphatase (non-canonical NTP hydrolase)
MLPGEAGASPCAAVLEPQRRQDRFPCLLIGGNHSNFHYNKDMATIQQLTTKMHQFVADQGWYREDSPKPQSPRNLAASLAVEAAEVLELYQWGEDVSQDDLADELADVTLYVLQLASVAEIDLEAAVLHKLAVNRRRSWPDPRSSQPGKR